MPRKTRSRRTGRRCGAWRFNEAAARCRGKRRFIRQRMRVERCFNEAAARCRGKRRARSRVRRPARRFNEAAARCRGKRLPVRVLGEEHEASMRPRPDATENSGGDGSLGAVSAAASMRPRPDAAENVVRLLPHRGDGAASMRPRPDAAENEHLDAAVQVLGIASMRPRPDAAENLSRHPCTSAGYSRFNEAAARCRGKPTRTATWWRRPGRASMRPRPDAAENTAGRRAHRGRRGRLQ